MNDFYERAAELVNDYVTQKHLRLVVDMPEGTQAAEIQGTGAVTLDLYLLMAAMKPVFMAALSEFGIEEARAGDVLDGLWEMTRADIMEQLGGGGE